MFQRLYFVTYFEHELENAAGKVSYAAGHFYHVAAELAEKLIGLGVAEEETARELRLEAEAKAKQVAADAKHCSRTSRQEKKITPAQKPGDDATESGAIGPPHRRNNLQTFAVRPKS
jgi:hypothetical protein